LPVLQHGKIPYTVDKELSIKIIRKAYDLGINFFDTANVYNGSIYPENAGLSESILGDALNGYNRESIVISTKFMGLMGNFPNASGLSKKYLMWQINESLNRMKLDYVDILHMHRPDTETPIDESLNALKIINDQGKVLYFGESYFHPDDIKDIMSLSKDIGIKMLSMQEPYNLLEREIEDEKFTISRNYGMGIMAYIPIAQGVLTDKYLNRTPEFSRASFVSEIEERYLAKNNIPILNALNEYAKNKGSSLSQIALAWMIKKAKLENISLIPIIGATRIEHLEDNIEALDIKINENDIREIEAIASEFKINWNSPYNRIKHSVF
jgi:aryl-alcohol dehydrogenase-like predicted oxidoreductase